MNAYQLRKQISTTQLAAQAAAIEADNARRPLHPDRLKVEDELWPKYKAEFYKARGARREQLVQEFEAEVNRALFPVQDDDFETTRFTAGEVVYSGNPDKSDDEELPY